MTVKPCNWCHSKPRMPDSSYCSARCANRKHQWNLAHQKAKLQYNRAARARKSAEEKTEAARIHQRELYSLRKVRLLLRETDDRPRRLRPEQKVRMWNLITDKIVEVKL